MSRPAAAIPPHVLLTTDTVGGVWTYARDLGQGLAAAGIRVTLATLGPGPDAAQHAHAQAVGLEVVALGGALDWTAADEGEVASAASALRALTERLAPDLLHLNSPALAAFGPLGATTIAACHSCVATWWAAVTRDDALPHDLAWRKALIARGYAAANALVAPSRAFAEATQRAYGLPRAPHVVLNGRTPIPSSRTSLSDVQVLSAGRLWDQGKDIATLDRAAERLPGVKVAVAGPTRSPSGEGGSWPHLRRLGALDGATLASHLRARPIFVSTSLYEPFGLAVLEAAQAGCALVLSDTPAFRELWDGAADFFRPGDDFALATRLAALAADPGRRQEQGAMARARASRYAVGAMTDATLGLYAQLNPTFARTKAVA